MVKLSCVVMFLEKLPVTFTNVASEVQKNFCEFENVEPNRLVLEKNQSMDDVPDDVPVCIFSSETYEIFLAKGRFVFTEKVLNELSIKEYSNKIKETTDKVTSILSSTPKFKGIKYRLGVVVEGNISSKSAAFDIVKDIIGNDMNSRCDEIELSVNNNKESQKYVLNCWRRIYSNENGNYFLVDINNHVNTPAILGMTDVNELYEDIIKDDLEVVLNDLSR